MASFRGVVGAEISEYTKLMGESREQVVDRMVAEAEALGGNAIVMARISTSQVMSGAAELLAYGAGGRGGAQQRRVARSGALC